ncbi:MAG: ackA [Bacillales bacterium]|jgi:acetate kinase|nr:ackA [Bacillales bacterium]
MSKIIAINAGSSSLKFQLFEMPAETVITKGLVERVGLPDSIFMIEAAGEKHKTVTDIPNHEVAVDMLLKKLLDHGIVGSLDEIEGVGHRVVHGGEAFPDSAVVNADVITKIEELAEFAPLHNPANLIGIRAFEKALPGIPAVVVFDTSFHATMPEKAYLYSIPYEFYKNFGVRKYGFHGTSHNYVSARAAELVGKDLKDLKIITCHIGNGGSLTAVDGGKSVDTSMGFTPLEGLTMGTRSGNLDPAIVPFLMKKLDKTAEEVVDIFNKQSGLLGLSGVSSDCRDIENAVASGNERAIVTNDIFVDRIKKHIGMYAAVMGGVDVIVFTAGVGENSGLVREEVMTGFEFMGVQFDKDANRGCREERIISTADSKVKVIVIPTNEEVMIARDVQRFI